MLVATFGLVGNGYAILLDRGSDMVYDTVLNITWTRQADYSGFRRWADANAWAENLVFGGFDDWRLPYASVSAGAGPTPSVHTCTGYLDEEACRDNEMGYMFIYNLGGDLGDHKIGTQTAAGGQVLTGINPDYWSGTELDSDTAWGFTFFYGYPDDDLKSRYKFAWAVRAGDIAAIAEPATFALLGLGLAGLGLARKRREILRT